MTAIVGIYKKYFQIQYTTGRQRKSNFVFVIDPNPLYTHVSMHVYVLKSQRLKFFEKSQVQDN